MPISPLEDFHVKKNSLTGRINVFSKTKLDIYNHDYKPQLIIGSLL